MMTVVFAILLMCALFFSALYLLYDMTFRSPRNARTQNDIHSLPKGEQYKPFAECSLVWIDEFASLPYEPMTIISRDGYRLFARFYRFAEGDAPISILCHGYRSNGFAGFCGGYTICRTYGHNVLLLDMRAHMNSEGGCLTFGAKERFDIADWANEMVRRFGSGIPIYLMGVSMGAASVIMATECTLPRSVCGVIADAPYSDATSEIRYVLHRMKLPMWLVHPIAWSARIFGHFDLRDADALRAIRKTKLPILIIHGTDDRFVPYENSERLIANAPGNLVTLETFPNAGHVLSYMQNTERYFALCKDFFRKYNSFSEGKL